jgi:branched-chain amino acid transport system substrate-binding protein
VIGRNILIVTCFLFCSSAVAFAQDIPVAAAGPMSGHYAIFGSQMKAGAEAAVADLNAAGGVMGKKLKLEIGDDACDPKQAVAVANKLAGQGIKFMAGHCTTNVTIQPLRKSSRNSATKASSRKVMCSIPMPLFRFTNKQ